MMGSMYQSEVELARKDEMINRIRDKLNRIVFKYMMKIRIMAKNSKIDPITSVLLLNTIQLMVGAVDRWCISRINNLDLYLTIMCIHDVAFNYRLNMLFKRGVPWHILDEVLDEIIEVVKDVLGESRY